MVGRTFDKLFSVSVGEVAAVLATKCRRCSKECSSLTLQDVVDCRKKNYSDSDAGFAARLAQLFWSFSRRNEPLIYRHASHLF